MNSCYNTLNKVLEWAYSCVFKGKISELIWILCLYVYLGLKLFPLIKFSQFDFIYFLVMLAFDRCISQNLESASLLQVLKETRAREREIEREIEREREFIDPKLLEPFHYYKY